MAKAPDYTLWKFYLTSFLKKAANPVPGVVLAEEPAGL